MRVVEAWVDLDRRLGALVGECLVAPFECHARQAEGDFDVGRLRLEDFVVQLLGLVEQAVGQQPIGLDLLLVVVDVHVCSRLEPVAWHGRAGMSRSFWRRIGDDQAEQALEQLAEHRAGRQAELVK